MQELINVQIENKSGINVVSSRVIADQLGKEHSKVIRSLESIISEKPDLASQIIESDYKVPGNNKTYKEYLLTKDGFTLYMFNIQGYNDYKMAYINRFNEMEKSIQISSKDRLLLQLFSNDPLQVANAHKALVEIETKPLIEKIENDKPLVEFADHVSQSVNCLDIGQFAQVLYDEKINLGRNRLFDWMRKHKYLKKSNEPYQQYVDLGYLRTVEQKFTTPYGNKRVKPKTVVTGKGQIYFTEKLRKEFCK